MNRIVTLASIAVLGAAIAPPAAAMGRHDEKPHGVTKPAQQQTQQQMQQRRQATGGRHDEGMTTHGGARAAAGNAEKAPAQSAPPAR